MAGYSISVHFKKMGMMRYISHLDLLRLFQRASRRADLPVALTEGFNPHLKLKIEPALKLGLESDNLRAEIVLTEEVAPDEIRKKLGKELPSGIEIVQIT